MRKPALFTGLLLLAFISINFAFPEKETNVMGTYRSKHYGLLRQGFNSFVLKRRLTDYNSELILYPDSSFSKDGRLTTMTGKWEASNDTLFLHVLTNRFRIDSLSETGRNDRFLRADGILKYKISANEIVRNHIVTLCDDSTRKFNGIETLVKAED